MTSVDARAAPLEFRGGFAGAIAPFALFLCGVGWLGISGAPDERGFWPILLAALTLGIVLVRDRSRYCETLIAAMSQPIVLLMIMAWLLAGVLGALMSATGFVQALVWLSRAIGVSGGGYVASAFLICCLVSTSTGTSLGTILICGPLLYPAGGPVGAHPAILMGSILAGATFGDSISPISDTTIASAGTQGADIGGVVRSRLKYVLPAGLAALMYAFVFGGGAPVVSGAAQGSGAPSGPAGLPMLLVPLLVVALLLKRRPLIEGLLFGNLAAVVLGLGLRLLRFSDLLRIEAGSVSARSLIVDGIERGVGVSIFTLFLVALVSTLEATRMLDGLVQFARARTRTARGAEWWIVGTVSAAVLLTTHSVVAILTVGEFARQTGKSFGLSAYRRANLLDVTVCTYPFLLPYFIPTVLAASASLSGLTYGMPRLSPLQAGLSNVYSWGLLVVVLIALVTGYGRTEAPPSDDTV